MDPSLPVAPQTYEQCTALQPLGQTINKGQRGLPLSLLGLFLCLVLIFRQALL